MTHRELLEIVEATKAHIVNRSKNIPVTITDNWAVLCALEEVLRERLGDEPPEVDGAPV